MSPKIITIKTTVSREVAYSNSMTVSFSDLCVPIGLLISQSLPWVLGGAILGVSPATLLDPSQSGTTP
jgi:hypothetical protein